MKKVMLAIFTASLFSQAALATELNAENLYPFYCGTKAEVIAANDGAPLSNEEWTELLNHREGILTILHNPKQTLKEAYESESGKFAVLVMCGSIVMLNPGLEQKGCVDLKTNQVVKDNGAVALCQSILAKAGK